MSSKKISHTETISAVIERVVYCMPENGYTVFRVRLSDQQDLQTIVGYTPIGEPGEKIIAEGRWVQSKTYGWQFNAASIQIKAPESLTGITRFLSSGAIPGIGVTYAKRLIAHFGHSVLEVLNDFPEKLTQVAGIGKLRAEKIIAGWHEQKAVRDIMIFLYQHGISTQKAIRIYAQYGKDAIDIIQKNPYQLAIDIAGISFSAVDRLASQFNIGQHSPLRVKAALWQVLAEANSEGHCGLPIDRLIDQAVDLTKLSVDFIEKNIHEGIREERFISDQIDHIHFVFPAWIYRSEHKIARLLKQFLKGNPPWKLDNLESKIDQFEKEAMISLSDSQKQALMQAVSNKVQIITGGPGVGKTMLVRAILFLLAEQNLRIALCAPTGRAARRLSESTQHPATTIHRLLGAKKGSYGFGYDELSPLTIDFLVIDECSMIDISLMLALLKAVPEKCAILLIGDVDQLPSIGPGRVFADMIDSKTIPTIFLTEVFRQALTSKIIQASRQILRGEFPDFSQKNETTDCFFLDFDQAEAILSRVVSMVTHRISAAFGLDARQDIQVICPMNRGTLGTRAINEALQYAFNDAGQLGIERGEQRYFVGDKVMQLENDYDREVFNGDIGYISSILPDQQVMTVDFEGRAVEYKFKELDNIALAYAITVHKSQGSEYPAVVFVLTMQHFPMLQRHLLYTAITRGKQLVVIVGQKKALQLAIQKEALPNRHSRLALFLKG